MAECPFCFEDFDNSERNPWAFPCGHLVCGDCIAVYCINDSSVSCRTCEQTFGPADTHAVLRKIVWATSPDVPRKEEDKAKRLVQVLKENRELKERCDSLSKDFLEASAKTKTMAMQLDEFRMLLAFAQSSNPSNPSYGRQSPVAGPSTAVRHHAIPPHSPPPTRIPCHESPGNLAGRQSSGSTCQNHRYGPYPVGPNPHRTVNSSVPPQPSRRHSHLSPPPVVTSAPTSRVYPSSHQAQQASYILPSQSDMGSQSPLHQSYMSQPHQNSRSHANPSVPPNRVISPPTQEYNPQYIPQPGSIVSEEQMGRYLRQSQGFPHPFHDHQPMHRSAVGPPSFNPQLPRASLHQQVTSPLPLPRMRPAHPQASSTSPSIAPPYFTHRLPVGGWQDYSPL